MRIFTWFVLKEKTRKLPHEMFSQVPMTPREPPCDVTLLHKKFKPKCVRIFLIEAAGDFVHLLKCLNSSLALSLGKLWLNKVRATKVALRSVKGFKQTSTAVYCPIRFLNPNRNKTKNSTNVSKLSKQTSPSVSRERDKELAKHTIMVICSKLNAQLATCFKWDTKLV